MDIAFAIVYGVIACMFFGAFVAKNRVNEEDGVIAFFFSVFWPVFVFVMLGTFLCGEKR
jgi:lipopolysaccharide export LptBFGC system permease protein LptF